MKGITKPKGFGIVATMLFATLLIGVVFVSAVSAEVGEGDLNPIAKVKLYATYELNYFAANTPEFEVWETAIIGKPVLIFDSNGDPVLYDVPVVESGKNIGIIKIWAKKSMGVPIYSGSTRVIEPSDEAKNVVEKLASEKKAQIDSDSEKVVYYDFPKRALSATLRQDGNIVGDVMVDITTGEPIPADKVKSFESMLDKEKMKSAMDMWERVDKQITSGKCVAGTGTKSVNQVTLNVPLFGQQFDMWCSPASAQMVLNYDGYGYTQGQIASAMETDLSTGTELANVPTGIEEVTNCQVDSWNDYGWWWSDLTDEIDNDHPFLTNSLTHTRAVRGYKEDTWLFWEKYLYINDPWPVNEGDVYWTNYYSDQMWNIAITLVH
ncbi:MAG: C39 family peptidase [Euryarchaeota archaeon]|nr:C39 family peptidase [Euryarchaeota archaeon]